MKSTLIVLTSVAAVLAIITYFTLFSGPQIVQPNQPAQNYTEASQGDISSSTQATSSAFTTDTSASSSTSPSPAYQTVFSAPYPINWTEGQPQLAIMGATLQGTQLVLSVNIQMGNAAQCVPINLRLIADEEGDMQAPDAPTAPNFPLAPDGTCQGEAETAYSESVIFTLPASTTAPWLFATGDPSNGFFEVATTTDNGLLVTVPQTNG